MKSSPQEIRKSRPRPVTSLRILADTATVGGWTAAIKVAGAVKVIVAARLFGAGDAMDAYLIAFLLPSFFIDVLAGSIDSALIPALVEAREKRGRAAAHQIYSSALSAAGAGFVVAAVLVAAASGWILPALASGFSPGKLAFTQRLLLAMIALVPATGLSATWRAVLNSEHRFAYAAAVPLTTPLASIAAMLFAGKEYGVMALAVATAAGAFLEAIASGVGAHRAGYSIVPHWTGVTESLRQVGSQYAPVVAITIVMTGSALIDQGMAGHLGSGSVAALSFGTRLLGVLAVIGPTAVGTAVLPHISSEGLLNQPALIRKTLRQYGLAIFAAVIPITGALIYFSEPIVRVLFQKGAFGESAAHMVSAVQRASLLQLPVTVLLALEVRLTSAMKANTLLYRVAALSLVLTFALDLIFMRWWGVVGIALAGVAIRLVSSLYLSCKISTIRAAFSSGHDA